MRDENNYFKTNLFLKILRFFNLLEPDVNVLSISKTFMWTMLGLLIFVLIYMPMHLELVISAIGVTMGSMLNYSYRRWIQYRREVTGKDIQDDADFSTQAPYKNNYDEYDIGDRR